MDPNNPVQWCLIAALAVLYSIYATKWLLAEEQPSRFDAAIAFGRYIMAFALLYNLPAPPPFAVPITTSLVLAVLILPNALRHNINRHRPQCTCYAPPAGPPDIERIP